MNLAFERLRCALVATVRRGGLSWMDAYLDALGRQAQHALERGALPDAEACCLYVLGLDPAQGRARECARALADVWSRRANDHARLGQLNEARDCLENVLRLDPNSVDALIALGDVFLTARHADEAGSRYRRALEIAPDSARGISRLGVVAAQAGDAAEAERLQLRAADLEPGDLEPLIHLGQLRQQAGQPDQALEYFRRAKAIDPICVEAHVHSGFARLSRGELIEGWESLEWRLRLPELQDLRRVDRPLWRGEDIAQRTLLLQREPGMADHIQFLRYVPMVASSGARVVVETFPEIHRLVARIPGVHRVVRETVVDDVMDLDVRCPILSLPHRFATTTKTIPSTVPYLVADPAAVATWSARLGELPAGLKVGFSWPDGSSAAELLAELNASGMTKAVFLNLQPMQHSAPDGVVDLTPELRDFADMADLIAALDVVIAPPAAVAHLAGALGKPTWILLRAGRAADWRWSGESNTSAWYPTARVLRQDAQGRWPGVRDA